MSRVAPMLSSVVATEGRPSHRSNDPHDSDLGLVVNSDPDPILDSDSGIDLNPGHGFDSIRIKGVEVSVATPSPSSRFLSIGFPPLHTLFVRKKRTEHWSSDPDLSIPIAILMLILVFRAMTVNNDRLDTIFTGRSTCPPGGARVLAARCRRVHAEETL
ncbi:hypothetical protein EVAR_13063_1 [Eumeta japonica]|uniref:Uncharacterized protein n=1 Tax=Eumeta variegata TaxID=151549 RepID=A0A4C1VH88_EUMVA|nr:hypothetical protein EVAR_13063_1 [Eumeta japonica]